MPPGLNVDFDKADFGAPPGDLKCATCPAEIRDRYFEVNGATVCPNCRALIDDSERPEGGMKRFVIATVLGIAGGAVGAAAWYAVAELFNLQIGLIAILVGWLVGTGVNKGAQGRGGRRYQVLAAFVTYASIVTTYIPPIYAELSKTPQADAATATAARPAGPAATAPADSGDSIPAAATADAATPSSSATTPDPPITFGAAIGGLLLAGAVLYAIAFAAPFLMGFENLIGILIIGFAVHQAWKMNARRVFEIKGPFRAGARPAAVLPSAPDDSARS